MQKVRHIALVALSLVLAFAFFLASTSAIQRTAYTQAVLVGTPVSLGEITIEANDSNVTDEDILWLARVIYSETKQPHEQELVAWVVRNRVETEYRGRDTYRGVVLDPWQFSAFNVNGPKRRHYMTLTEQSQAQGWQKALEIAERVAMAGETARPFSPETRHFYSRQSMVGRRAPAWAHNRLPVKLDREVVADRFRFYAGVS